MKTLEKTYKYFIYCRRSSESEDKQVASIEDQLVEMRKTAEQQGLKVVDTITESKSAKKPGREGFNSMMARIEKGEADGIICWKLNRLARNPIDGGRISWLIQQSIIKHIKTHSGSFYPTDNVVVMAVELGIANQYVKDLSEDVKRGMRQKAMRGWYPHSQLTSGYIHNPKEVFESGDDEILPDPERFPVIRKGWDMLLSGTYSMHSVYESLCNDHGLRNKNGRTYSQSTMQGIFENKFYCGYFDWTDETGAVREIKGHHKPMITEEEFEKVQKLFGKNGRPRQYEQDLNFPFRGPTSCGDCGCKITAERKRRCICTKCKNKFSIINRTDCPKCGTDMSEMKNPSLLDITYYHCTGKREGCKQKGCVTEKVLNDQTKEYLSSITIPQEFHPWLMQGFQEIHKEEIIVQKDLVSVQNRKEMDLVNRLDRYTRMRGDGEIDAEQYKKYRDEVEREISIIKRNRTTNNDRLLNWFDIAENYVQFAKNSLIKFENGTVECKKSIVAALGSNPTLKDKNLCVSLPKTMTAIKEVHRDFFGENSRFEPRKNVANKRKNTSPEMLSLVLLPG